MKWIQNWRNDAPGNVCGYICALEIKAFDLGSIIEFMEASRSGTNKRAYIIISDKACLLGSIKVKRQTLSEKYTHLFDIL